MLEKEAHRAEKWEPLFGISDAGKKAIAPKRENRFSGSAMLEKEAHRAEKGEPLFG